MANTYYSISPSTTLNDIKTALTSKFDTGITYHYSDSETLIFTCAALSNKVIKLYRWGGYILGLYGDAYVSNQTISNEVQFFGYGLGTMTEAHLILGDNLLFITYLNTTLGSVIGIIGKLDNDDYAVLGFIGDGGFAGQTLGKNTTDAVDIVPAVFSSKFTDSNSKLYTQKITLVRADGTHESKIDGSISSFQGILNISHQTSSTSLLKLTNSIYSSSSLFMSGGGLRLPTCIFAEF